MRHFQRHQLSRNTLLLWMVFEILLIPRRQGRTFKLQSSNFQA